MARQTRQNILDVAGNLFGLRGFDAVSLDQIAAEVGVAKQTVLYWFSTKDELVHEVLSETASELTKVVEAAIRSAPDDPLDRMEAVVKAVFRPAVRRPSLLGLVRGISRLPSESSDQLTDTLAPLAQRAMRWMSNEMDAGRLRRGDPSISRCSGVCDGDGHRHRARGIARGGMDPRCGGSASSSLAADRLRPRCTGAVIGER